MLCIFKVSLDFLLSQSEEMYCWPCFDKTRFLSTVLLTKPDDTIENIRDRTTIEKRTPC